MLNSLQKMLMFTGQIQYHLSKLVYMTKLFSPGPGLPAEHEIMFEILDAYKENKSILGICLGHQAIAEYFGCSLVNLSEVKHGIISKLNIYENSIIFNNVPNNIKIGHYHSWVIKTTYTSTN